MQSIEIPKELTASSMHDVLEAISQQTKLNAQAIENCTNKFTGEFQNRPTYEKILNYIVTVDKLSLEEMPNTVWINPEIAEKITMNLKSEVQ